MPVQKTRWEWVHCWGGLCDGSKMRVREDERVVELSDGHYVRTPATEFAALIGREPNPLYSICVDTLMWRGHQL